MKKLFNLTVMATLLSAIALFSGCSDEIVQPETKSTGGELLSRGAYDYPPVEWDNVSHIAISCSLYPTENKLPVPWAGGVTKQTGIPDSWIDHDLLNADPKKRAYSRANGWVMVFHNLSESTENKKYFGLYNKYTGILRMFFYEIAQGGNLGTSTAWQALRVSGSSSLLNFNGSYPAPINDRKNDPMFFASTLTTISPKGTEYTGYQPNNWYGMEVELAYDANATSTNKLSARLWAQYITSLSISGTTSGTIEGNIQTVYSNSPSSMQNITLNASIGNTTINNTYGTAQNELEKKDENGGSFFKNLWNNIKGQVPQLANQAAKEGIKVLLSGGTSAMVKGLSKLLGLSGHSSTPMTSTSKVDLGLKSNTTLNGSEETNVVGWGKISGFDLPQFANNNHVFSGRLGVWNLQDYPKVTVDLLATSLYYPKELVPNPTRPRASYPTYSYSLSNATLVINPDLLSGYKVENMSQQLVFTSGASAMLGTAETGTAYGLYGDTEY